jgi:hypothetical protein
MAKSNEYALFMTILEFDDHQIILKMKPTKAASTYKRTKFWPKNLPNIAMLSRYIKSADPKIRNTVCSENSSMLIDFK